MPVYVGSSQILSAYIGSTPVQSIYAGSTQVWTTGPRTIAEENALGGYAPANWQVTGIGDTGALGYATKMTVEAGDSIGFKVHSGATGYTIEIVRLGWYGGNGARLVTTLSHPAGTTQSDGTLRTNGEGGVGSRDCSGWSVTDTWTVPGDVTHGVYIGVIKRTGQAQFSHIGPFVVSNARNDAADILCKFSDMTWRAYNTMGTISAPTGGKSLYGTGSGTIAQNDRAWDVTYDAPLVVASGVPQTSYWNGEQPVYTFLERNGYDVGYTTGFDVDLDASILLGRKVIVSTGHDEYWSQNMRDAWDDAVASGVHAVFFSGNTMLWRTRMGTSSDARRMFCYKDSHSLDGTGAGLDPGDEWTGTWRDTRWTSRRAETETVGAAFVANGIRADEIVMTATYAAKQLWRNTTVAALTGGSTETLKADCLGFEWDTFEPSYTNTLRYPLGLELLSSTSINLTGQAANENGSQYSSTINPCLHRITAFKTGTSLTVNFGTNQWGWGLSDLHARGTTGENTTMKQATVNLLADMGCQPVTLQSGLTAATDQLASWTFPTATAVTIPPTVTLSAGNTQQLTATATWSNSITTDVAAQATWGTSNASVATVSSSGLVTAVATGSATITATVGAQSDTCTVTVSATYDHVWTGATPTPDTGDTSAYNMGSYFSLSSATAIVGVRLWNPGAVTVSGRTATLWTHNGSGGSATAQRTVDVPDLLPAGWSDHLFSTPYNATTGVNYCVSCWFDGPNDYGFVTNGLNPDVTTGPITMSVGAFTAGGSPGSTCPTGSSNNFYGVDVLYGVVDPGDVTALDVTPATATIATAATQQLTAMASWENISPTDVTATTSWVSNATGIATVSSTGLVTGVTAGSATVTGTYSGFSDTCGVTVSSGGGGGGTFINHVAIAAPRNGTTSHTVNPASGTAVAGTLFTPTAGRLLVVVVEGAVTSSTPSGWTLPTGGSAVNNTGLYVWHRTAAGSDTLTTTHNASNYPVTFHWFEFATGSTFRSSTSATGVGDTAANPNLTGLTGTNWVAGAKARAQLSGNTAPAATWSGGATEALDYATAFSTTDGHWLGIGYIAGHSATSYQPTCTATIANGSNSFEALTFAVNAT